MMKEQNIPQDSLIAGYLPADYCDSFSRNVVSEKAITSDEFFDMAFNHSPAWVNGLMKLRNDSQTVRSGSWYALCRYDM